MVRKQLAAFGFFLACMWGVFSWAIYAQGPIDTTITFQGRLIQNGTFVSDTCDFQFTLFNTPSAGTQQGPIINKTAVSVLDGYFTADLDFGAVFSGDKRYLQITVQCSADGGPTALNGRVELTAAPYALYALNAGHAGDTNWANVSGIPAGFADDVDNTGELSNFVCNQSGKNILVATGTGSWVCGTDAGSVPLTLDHGIHLITTSLADDDHPQYLLVNGSRAMTGNLSMGSSNRIINLANGINPTDAVNRGQTVEQTETGGDLAGTYGNATVIGIRNRDITSTTPISGQGLIWNNTAQEWQPGLVGPSGPAGGDFSGNFPVPQIAPGVVDAAKIANNGVDSAEIGTGAVGMSELNTPIGYGALANQTFVEGPNVATFIFVTSPFTPDTNGQCFVVASASVNSSGGSGNPSGYLRTARRMGGSDLPGGEPLHFGDSATLPSVTSNNIWSVTAGQAVRFGCYIFSLEAVFGNNETIDCRVSYICQ